LIIFSDDRSMVALARECEFENSVGLLFPNWGPCKYRGNGCPLSVQEKREAGLLMGYCSNNYSVRDCLVYRVLELEESL